ncbi:MAG: hypothetical protein HETSPECPRED_004459 [Heterodermia speciosa]|uniref:Bacteriophage T5 Orf172 DNA-binding domain-containing protein n=1 Tax=Heterodermia speciosa TaxID=116794 RepID=A0A8H3F9I5_9LECA|nr:MAG: hypothetical protein HETSPECPRED_004459 [Heterodermia speciosa]
MPFIPNTPESLLPRSDSKNPATTCKGITESGRPCRRSLAFSPASSPLPKLNRRTKNGVLAVLPGDSEHEGAAAFFCWQHKDQAATLQSAEGTSTPGQGNGKATTLLPLTERTSIDTLVDRLGVLDVQDEQESGRRKRTKRTSRPIRKETLPKNWQDVQGPLMALPHEGSSSNRPPPREKRRRPGFWESLCCVNPAYDSTPPARVRPQKASTATPATTTVPTSVRPLSAQTPKTSQRPSAASPSPLTPTVPFPNRARRTSSHTQTLLALIPPDLSPQTTSALLSELAKPVSQHDEEGWIYIFWLTSKDSTETDPNAVTSLLNAPQSPGRRTISSVTDTGKTILLKIGRASNVQRRMNEWTRQCGYDLSLVRFYPYLPSAPSPLPSPSRASHSRTGRGSSQEPGGATAPHKVPHAHKVERLIHLELADQRVKKNCEACGKEHREWFEVAGTREGVKAVDEVVRRWVVWAEGSL